MKLSAITLGLIGFATAQDFYDGYQAYDYNTDSTTVGTTLGTDFGPGLDGARKNKNKNNQYNSNNNNNNNNNQYNNQNQMQNNNQQQQYQNNNQNQQYNQNQNQNNNQYGTDDKKPDPYQPKPEPPKPVIGEDACWHCDQPTLELCKEKGMVKNCRSGNPGGNVCMIEMRERDGKLFGVCMGCKDESTCLNQKYNNFLGQRPNQHQCKPESTQGPSVCRSCCKGKNCWGDDKNPFKLTEESTIADWKKDYIGDKKDEPKKPNQYGN